MVEKKLSECFASIGTSHRDIERAAFPCPEIHSRREDGNGLRDDVVKGLNKGVSPFVLLLCVYVWGEAALPKPVSNIDHALDGAVSDRVEIVVVPALQEQRGVARFEKLGRGEVEEENEQFLLLGGQSLSLLNQDSEVVDYLLRGLLHVGDNHKNVGLVRVNEILQKFMNGRLGDDTGQLAHH